MTEIKIAVAWIRCQSNQTYMALLEILDPSLAAAVREF